MKLTTTHPLTGLPHIQETRARGLWQPLPRKIRERVEALEASEETKPWWPRHHEWDGMVLQRVRCWKCGTPVKGWRPVLESHRVGFDKDGHPITQATANPVLIAGKPAVALQPFPNLVSTLVRIRWPALKETAVFAAQHCADCTLTVDVLEQVIACYLGGVDAILYNAWNHKHASTVTPDRWATYLYRWSGVEPVGLATQEDAMNSQKVPAPGELLTAAQLMMDFDEAKRSVVPSGAKVEFTGPEIPPGWVQDVGSPGKIVKL